MNTCSKSFTHLMLTFLIPSAFLIFQGCGGNSSPEETVTLTVNVDDPIDSSGKKGRTESSVDEVTVFKLNGDEFGEAEEISERVFKIEVPKGVGVHIKVKLSNSENGSLFFEKIIAVIDSSREVDVDSDSTYVVALIIDESVREAKDLEELIEENNDIVREKEVELESVVEQTFLARLLEELVDIQDIEELSAVLERALNELARILEILDAIEDRLNHFESGDTSVAHDALRNTDFEEGDFEHDADHYLSAEELADQTIIAEALSDGETDEGISSEGEDISISLTEDGEVIVVRGDESTAIDIVLRESDDDLRIVTGVVLVANANEIVLLVETDTGRDDIGFVVPESSEMLMEIAESLNEGDHVGIGFLVEEETRIVKNIRGHGRVHGFVVEKSDSSITVKDFEGNVNTYYPRWISGVDSAHEIEIAVSHDETGDSTTLNGVETASGEIGLEAVEVTINESELQLDGTETATVDSALAAVKKALHPSIEGYLDPEMLDSITHLETGDEVVLRWEIDEKKRVIEIYKVDPEPEPEPEPEPIHITVRGKVGEKGDNFFTLFFADGITIKVFADSAFAFHSEIVEGLLVGDEISVTYRESGDGNILVETTGSGTHIGTLLEKNETAIFINDGVNTVRYVPNWIPIEGTEHGGLDPEMLAIIADMVEGIQYEITWKLEERKRVLAVSSVDIQVLPINVVE